MMHKMLVQESTINNTADTICDKKDTDSSYKPDDTSKDIQSDGEYYG